MDSERPALILLGHGARDAEWRRPIDAIHRRLVAFLPTHRVEVAFHEFIGPSLCDVVDRLQSEGCRSITVIPVFIAQGGHLRSDIPAAIQALRARYPVCRIDLAPAVGESSEVQEAIARHCASAVANLHPKN